MLDGFRFLAEARCVLGTPQRPDRFWKRSSGYRDHFSRGLNSHDVELTTNPFTSWVSGIGTIIPRLNTSLYCGTGNIKHRRKVISQISGLQLKSTVRCLVLSLLNDAVQAEEVMSLSVR
jgi:hypothetical protein